MRKILRRAEYAKDIRLYTMQNFLSSMTYRTHDNVLEIRGQIEKYKMYSKLSDVLLILIRDSVSYAYLIYLLLNDRITIGMFTLVFAAIGNLAKWISGILTSYNNVILSHKQISDFRTYLDYPDKEKWWNGAIVPIEKDFPVSISLKNVSYTYPKSGHAVLENINIDIKPGERLAIVGVNGAGKTTLVKLICGLYHPQQGEIRLNDVNIKDYDRDEYFKLFSTVFQDIYFTASTGLIGNVSSTSPESTEKEKFKRCLKLAGIYDRVQQMSEKEYTGIVRHVDDNGIELSGGEKQKVALARALYKDAPIIILDEPTAALDPISENQLYQNYAELTKGKTSIYISHRLASTCFCDRILVLDDHRIIEEGTHEELMRKNGKYAKMFRIQSSYYSESRAMDI